MNNFEDLESKIESCSAKLCVLGLGYVGLPLSMLFSAKFQVIGYDQDPARVEQLIEGVSYIKDVPQETLADRLHSDRFHPTTDEKDLTDCDIYIICVPTPLNEEKYPDLSFLETACDIISKHLSNGNLVILESTTYPGTTDDVMVPLLERSGLKGGDDFFAAFSPERVDPGSQDFKIETTPKVVGGITEASTDLAFALYNSVMKADVIPVSNCKIAEASKILENIFRGVNIALINEMALIFEKMGINTWEVIHAAATKPFAFMPHYPGPGIGGHCIPLDPYYLSYEARKFGVIPRFIELSGEINEFMKIHTVNKVREGLNRLDKKLADSKIMIMGVAYKKDISDTRESPAVTIIEELVRAGAEVRIYDPFVDSISTKAGQFESAELDFDDIDCLVFITDHTEFKNISAERLKNKVVIDCRNIFDESKLQDVIYLGLGKPSSI